ncbi:virion RNA polymerase [Sinorhizobium phage ort11]|uniref:Virion RNA polymerase n=1 Tax=Sinorhizobium phage ort11 TaxID=2599764 RepID=A0A5C2H3R5_9CAUD|nr:virion RNA polymerase [Sinorhizobium phage ort11]QEP29865.1 virion RNA polymerase [Sinorhizobium phage ort11]
MADPINPFSLFPELNINQVASLPTPGISDTVKANVMSVSDNKKQELVAMSDAKKQLLGPSQNADVAAVSLQNENNLTNRNQVLLDAASMNPFEFEQKYPGVDPQLQANLASARDRLSNAEGMERTGLEIAADSLNSGVQGAVGSAGGILALGAGLVDDRAGAAISGALGSFSEAAQDLQSDTLNRTRNQAAIAGELDAQDNEEQYQVDRQTDGDTVAGLKRIGRDFGAASVRTLTNPTLAGDIAAQGVGSLLVAGPTGKAIATAGKPLTKIFGEVGGAIIEKGAMPAAIGSMEAGGAYTQASQEVMDMTHDQLSQNSEFYRERIAVGDTPEQAKLAAANRAGQISAAIAGPAGALTGTLVSRFEAAPFRVPSLGSATGNVFREGVEEAGQGLTGQVGVNLGIQQAADENRSLTEDVGENIANSLVGGVASAGVVQTPGAVLRTAANAVKDATDAVVARGQRVEQTNAAASPVAPEVIRENIEQAVNQVPAVAEGLQKVAQVTSQEEQAELNDYIGRVARTALISPEEIASIPDNLRSVVSETNNRFDVLMDVASIAADPEADINDRLSSAIYVRQQLRENEATFFSDLPNAIKNASEDSEEIQQLRNYMATIVAIDQDPDIAQINKLLDETDSLPDMETITADDVTRSVGLAEFNPSAVNPDVNDRILRQSDEGNITLSPEERKALQASSSLVRAGQQFASTMEEMGQPIQAETPASLMKAVNNQIEKFSSDPNKLSLNQHLSGIIEATQSGNPKLARDRAVRLGQFARHMRNKMDAVNRSFAAGEAVDFQAYDGTGKQFTTKSPKIHKGSSKLAQQIYAEAQYAATLNNNIAEIYPELGIQPITVPTLVPALRKPVDQQVQEVRNTRVVPVNRTQEASQRVVETPIDEVVEEVQDEVLQSPVVETEVVSETIQEEVNDESAPVVSTVREEAQPEARQEVQESVQGNEQETTEGLPTESGTEIESTTTVETLYPNLLTVEGVKNHFLEAFKLPREMISRLVGEAEPIKKLRAVLKDKQSLNAELGRIARYGYDKPIARSYRQYLDYADQIGEAMHQRLVQAITRDEGAKGQKKESLLDLIKKGTDVADFVDARGLSIVDKEKGRYEPALLQQAIAAGLHWVLNAERASYTLDKEQIAKILGIDESDVDDKIEQGMNRGLYITEAKRSLAQTIQQFWGVQGNSDVTDSYVKGIPEAVAAEVLYGLQAAGLITLGSFDYQVKGDPRQAVRIYFDERNEEIENLIGSMSVAPAVIADAVLVNNPDDPHIGQAPTQIADTQMRNPLVKNTAQQREAIRKAQETPFYVNQTMFDFLKMLGEEAVIELFGGTKIDNPKQFNENHLKSIQGKNLGLQNSYRNIFRQLGQVQNIAGNSNVPVTEMPVYYEHNVSRVGRLHMQGASNPQSDKMAREAFMSTRTTLDMTKPEDVQKFWMTIAQAVGVKTEKDTRAVAVQKAQEKIAKIQDHLPAFEAFIENGTAIPTETLAAVKEAFGGDLSFKAVHAILSVAKLGLAQDLTNFEHFLSLEADGKTDGPINALVHFTAGLFDSTWLKNVAKGGLFFGVRDKTLNAHQSVDDEDLYQEATKKLRTKQADFRNLVAGTDAEAYSNALLEVMNALNADVKFENGQLELSRGVTKNPLTITIYGSGIDGIAGKVASGLVETFYEQLSDALQGNGTPDPKLLENLELLINGVVIPGDKGTFKVKIEGKATPFTGSNNIDASKFTFTKEQLDRFKSNVKTLFVNQMDGAIQEMMGPSMDTTRKVQKSIQVQSIALKHLFQQRVMSKLAEKKGQEFLSQREMNKIYKELAKYSPLISTGTQTFFVGGSERSDVGIRTFARALQTGTQKFETVTTPAYIYGPENAGVAGVPYMVIGTGDGQMVQNIITGSNAPEGALYVFDGVEMKASTIDEDSRKINEAVFDGWMGNPVQSVSESFSAFLNTDIFDQLDDAGKQEIMEALYGKSDAAGTAWEDALNDISDLNAGMVSDAQSIEARHRAMERVELSVDHMASAEQAYTNEGEVLPTDPVELLTRINEIYNEELAKIQGRKAPAAVETPTNEFVEKINKLGFVDSDSGARIVDAVEFDGIEEIPQELLNAIEGDGYTFVIGSPAQLSAHEAQNDPANHVPNDVFYGKINTLTKTIYISNPSPETITHELVHAATLDKVYNFYADNNSVSKQDADAIRRLEALMREWLNQDYSKESVVAQEARRMAYSTVADKLNKKQTAAALNEFMAWSLSNEALASVQKKTKVKDKLAKIAKDVVNILKKLVGLPLSDTLWSNIRFNTAILLSTPTTFRENASGVIAYHSPSFGSDERLTELRERFHDRVLSAITEVSDEIERDTRTKETEAELTEAQAVAESFRAHGFPMNMQQASTFQMIHAAFATEAKLNPASMARIQEIYAHVTQKLNPADFITSEHPDQNEEYQAQEKFRSLTGVYLTKTDRHGRTNLLPAFLALAMVDDGFRDVLSKIESPKSERNNEGTVDALLENLGNAAMDRLSVLMAGEPKGSDAKAALDALTKTLTEQVQDQRTFIEQQTDNIVSGFDGWVRDKFQDLSGKLADKATEVRNNSNNTYVKAAANFIKAMTAIVNNETAEHVASAVTSAMNQQSGFVSLRELTTEIIGRTKENANIFDMISLVRSAVQQTRQQFREHLPTKIANHFTRPISEDEWSHLFKGLGKTDIASLLDAYDMDTVLAMLSYDTRIDVITSQIESNLKASEGALFNRIHRAAQDLANFMNTGKASGNTLRNAYAVANLFGAGGRKTAASEQTIQAVDHLVTLYALKGLNQDVKATLSSLAQSEKDGLDFAINYLRGQRADEQLKITTGAARANHYKGYIPSENQVGTSLIVAEDTEYARLITLGYTRVSDYTGSQAEGRGTKRGYYYAPVSGRAPFNQGVLQTVHTTASGVDPNTGRTTQDLTAGAITNPDEIARIIKNMHRNQNAVEPLLPVYDESGDVIAFERSIDPAQMARMNRNTHLGQMIGAWRGRQVEEALAEDFNKQLIEHLAKIWNEQKKGRANEFVDLANLKRSDDAVLHDAWNLVPARTKDTIKEVFGGEGFRVRRDMLNDAIGFRSASVGDIWTGTTRWKPAVTERLRQAAVGVFDLAGQGQNAFKYLVQAERFTQNVVADARVLIVVKSMIVPLANIMSNGYQLMGRGVPLRNILKGMGEKTVEINQYIKNRERQIELEADLRAAGNDLVKQRKIQSELQSIKDSNRRMTIAPLIEHGEFSSISDGGITQEDLALSNGRFVTYLENQAKRLPAGLRTAGRYALITKDTALFKGLARAVQYGDFIAKAIMYDDLIKRQGLSREQALGQVSEEFVNYNRLAGRTRNYLESVGLLWFWNFKLRSMKVAASMIRNNPVRAFMAGMMAPSFPVIGSIGSPVTDNFLSVMVNGKLDYSVGPGMGLNSWNLNPWMQLFK